MKNRWTEKERSVTAKKMAELTIAGQTVNLNKYFSNFTDRTVEAVKGQQSKNAIYKALVTEYLETLPQLGEPQPVAFQVADPQENLNVPDPEHDLNECIRQYLLTQQPLLNNEWKTHRLGRVCEDLRNRNITHSEATVEILEVFPRKDRRLSYRASGNRIPVAHRNRRASKREQFARLQDL